MNVLLTIGAFGTLFEAIPFAVIVVIWLFDSNLNVKGTNHIRSCYLLNVLSAQHKICVVYKLNKLHLYLAETTNIDKV